MKSFAPFLASKATYICHNEEQAVLYYQAASHHQHNTQGDLLTQAVNTASFIHVFFFLIFILYSMQSLDGMHYTHLIKSSHVHNKPHYAFGGERAGQELVLSFCRTASDSVIVCVCMCVRESVCLFAKSGL